MYFRDTLDLSVEEVHNPGHDAAISLINGRFIVDGQHFLREIRCLEFHRTTCLQSSNGYFRLMSTSTKSLVWRLDFQCHFCKLKRTIFSEPSHQGVENEETIGENVNTSLKIADSAVWGFMSTGGGHANLEEVFSTMGIRSIDKATFGKCEEKLGLVSGNSYASYMWKRLLIFKNKLKISEIV